MNSGVARLDQIIPILLRMNRYGLQFGFAHAEDNLIKLKLYYN